MKKVFFILFALLSVFLSYAETTVEPKLTDEEKQEFTVKIQQKMGHAEKSVAGLPKKSPCSDTESNNRMYLCTWKINQQYMSQ